MSGADEEPRHISDFDPETEYSKKVDKHFANEASLEALIAQDEDIIKIKVDKEKGITPEIAAKISKNAIDRLAANRKKLKKLREGRGITEQ